MQREAGIFLLTTQFNPLNAELNPICHLLALLGAHHIFHVSGLRVKLGLPGSLKNFILRGEFWDGRLS